MWRPVGLLLMSILVHPSVQQCDLLTAVKCFATMPDVPKPHFITNNPQDQLITPCVEQLDKTNNLLVCLNNSLTSGCEDILNDATLLIEAERSLCNSVVNDCGADVFIDDYKDILNCSASFFLSLVSSPNGMEDICQNFSTCLVEETVGCSAMKPYALTQWDNFKKNCEPFGVMTPIGLMMNDTDEAPVIGCETLDELSMHVYQCHNAHNESNYFNGSFALEEYCSARTELHNCVHEATHICPQLADTYDLSAVPFNMLTNIMCGNNETGTCDFSRITTCHNEMSWKLLKLEKLLEESEELNMDNIIDHVMGLLMQETSVIRNLVITCNDDSTEGSFEASETCLNDSLSGCPEETYNSMLSRVTFAKELCEELTNCSSIQDAIDTCATNVRDEIQALAENVTDGHELEFLPSFCMSIGNLITCLNNSFSECPGPSDHISTLYAELVKDVNPLCTADGPQIKPIMDGFPLPPEMQEYLNCQVLTIGESIAGHMETFALDIAKNPTNSEELCMHASSFLTEIRGTSEYCPIVARDMALHIEQVVAENLPGCQLPTTTTITTTPSPDGSTNSPPDGNGDGGDGGGNGGGQGGDNGSLVLGASSLLIALCAVIVHGH